MKLPSLLAVVALIPACGNGNDPSPCVKINSVGQQVLCSYVAENAPQTSCPMDCTCESICADSSGTTCHGQTICMGSDGSCPGDCDNPDTGLG